MITKKEYDGLISKYSTLEKEIVKLEERRKITEEECEKVENEIKGITKGNDTDKVLAALEKEVEARTQILRTKVSEFERLVQDLVTGEEEDDVLSSLD